MQLKVFRGEGQQHQIDEVLALVQDDLAAGKLSMVSINWSASMGLAVSAGAEDFVSTDTRQIALARLESIRVQTI